VLIFDEHATGLGRTGVMWAGDAEGVVPDVIFFGKYLGNGYPITAVACRETFRQALNMEGQSSTHGGQPVACAAALASVEVLLRDNLTAHAARVGAVCLAEMQAIQARHAIIGVAQGRGLQLAFEFVDPISKAPAPTIAEKVYVECLKRGVCPSLVHAMIRVSPMMVASQAASLKALRVVEEAIAHVERNY